MGYLPIRVQYLKWEEMNFCRLEDQKRSFIDLHVSLPMQSSLAAWE